MVTAEDHGTLVLVRPLTTTADVWLREHTDGTWFGAALVVEHRFVRDLLQAMVDEGFALS